MLLIFALLLVALSSALAAGNSVAGHLKDRFVTFIGDYRDAKVMAGLSLLQNSWVLVEASYCNGFMSRLLPPAVL